jgi:hypothetical protein
MFASSLHIDFFLVIDGMTGNHPRPIILQEVWGQLYAG